MKGKKKPVPVRGKKAKPFVEPTHLRKSALAHELGVSRVMLDAYLNRTEPPPPQPNRFKEFSIEEVANYIAKFKIAAGDIKGQAHWKSEKFRLECERIAFDLAARRREFVTRQEITTAIVPLMAELAQSLEMQFVQILPARCRGKTVVEIAEMNRAAVDQIIARFRSGSKEVGAT